jgi:hypothetical protein
MQLMGPSSLIQRPFNALASGDGYGDIGSSCAHEVAAYRFNAGVRGTDGGPSHKRWFEAT